MPRPCPSEDRLIDPRGNRVLFFPVIYRTRVADAGTMCLARLEDRRPRDPRRFFLLFTGSAKPDRARIGLPPEDTDKL